MTTQDSRGSTVDVRTVRVTIDYLHGDPYPWKALVTVGGENALNIGAATRGMAMYEVLEALEEVGVVSNPDEGLSDDA